MAEQLNQQQIGEYKMAFDLMTGGKTVLTQSALEKSMKALGKKLEPQNIRDIMREADMSGSGNIEFSEFLSVMTRGRHSNAEEDKEMKLAFDFYDTDKDGRISKRELKTIMDKYSMKFSEDEFNEMFQEADRDKDGYVNFSEFQRLIA